MKDSEYRERLKFFRFTRLDDMAKYWRAGNLRVSTQNVSTDVIDTFIQHNMAPVKLIGILGAGKIRVQGITLKGRAKLTDEKRDLDMNTVNVLGFPDPLPEGKF
ncbi:MAG: hypothetical protein V1838_04040 [Patescibacteria group bacterium]